MIEMINKLIRLIGGEFIGLSPLMIFVEAVAGCALIFFLCKVYEKKNSCKIENKKYMLFMILFLYLCFVLNIAIIRRPQNSRGEIQLVNELLFDHWSIRNICYDILNIFLFIPIGCLFQLINKKKESKKISKTVLHCFVISLLIEVIQLATGRGNFELIDIITNDIGGLIGAIFCVWILKREKKSGRII